MKVDFKFACRDDCLDLMVLGDLRKLIVDRDDLERKVDKLKRELELEKCSKK